MRRDRSGVILLYHRIAEPETDPFELAVSSRQFLEHLDVLETLGRIRSLAELVRDVGSHGRGRPSFALTFDDGYQDNLSAVKPILEERGVSATVFVTTGFVGGHPFWWDELVGLLLGNRLLPERLELNLDGLSRGWDVATAELGRVFNEVWTLLMGLDDDSRRRAVAALRTQMSGPLPPGTGRSLTVAELTELARGELVSIGAHTQTHPVLTRLSGDAARTEILGSKEWLEDVLGEPVTAFSYPYGGSAHYGHSEVEIVRTAGFVLACSGEPGRVSRGCDPLQLPRVTVKKWGSNDLERTITELTRRGRRW